MVFEGLKAELSDDWLLPLGDIQLDTGFISYESFSKLALFHPQLGYYAKPLERVGKSREADFYTASSHNTVFPELVCDAIISLTNGENLGLVEIGAEPGTATFVGHSDNFKTIHLGDELDIPERAVVFSNELFDAQPFQRWVYKGERWRPVRLKLEGSTLSETLEGSETLTESEAVIKERLPACAGEGYRLDISHQAEQLLEKIVSQAWSGLFIAIDYGHMWKTLTTEFPEGTARAYHKQQQVNNLLERPGDQDLTTHVCWDFLKDALHCNGFNDVHLKSQEAFFMTHAQDAIKTIVEGSETLASARKSQLLELISPGYFGQKFQVLYAKRGMD